MGSKNKAAVVDPDTVSRPRRARSSRTDEEGMYREWTGEVDVEAAESADSEVDGAGPSRAGSEAAQEAPPGVAILPGPDEA